MSENPDFNTDLDQVELTRVDESAEDLPIVEAELVPTESSQTTEGHVDYSLEGSEANPDGSVVEIYGPSEE